MPHDAESYATAAELPDAGPWAFDRETRRYRRLTVGERWFALVEPEAPAPVRCSCLHHVRTTRGLIVASRWCDRCDNGGWLPG